MSFGLFSDSSPRGKKLPYTAFYGFFVILFQLMELIEDSSVPKY